MCTNSLTPSVSKNTCFGGMSRCYASPDLTAKQNVVIGLVGSLHVVKHALYVVIFLKLIDHFLNLSFLLGRHGNVRSWNALRSRAIDLYTLSVESFL